MKNNLNQEQSFNKKAAQVKEIITAGMHSYFEKANETNSTDRKTAGVYIRSASSENSLEHSKEQLYLISKFALLNDIKIEFVFEDLGVSSLNYYYQDGLYSSLIEIRNNKIDYLLIADPSRISRKPYIYAAFQDELDKFGTRILPISNVEEMKL